MFRFTLTYSGADTEVPEPKGWSEFKSELKRDFKSHGVIFKYTSGTLKLGFAGPGRDVLETAFQADGFDAEVMLTVDKRTTATDPWVTVFTGNAIMENRELSELYFEVDFETSTFIQKVINRMDAKVRLDATEDMDGGTLSGAITSYSDIWADIRLINNYRANFRIGADSSLFETYSNTHNTTDGTPVYMHLLVNYAGELEDVFGDAQVITEAFNDEQLAAGTSDYNFIVNADNEGTLTVTGTFKYRFYGTLTTDASQPIIPLNLRLYLRHEDSAGVLQSQTQAFKKTINIDTLLSPVAYNSGVLSGSISATNFNVDPGDHVFFYAEVEANVTDGGSVSTTNATNIDWYQSSNIKYALKKNSGSNTVQHYLIHDVIERILYIIGGEDGMLHSSFLGLSGQGYSENGCGALISITNGYLLRGIDNPPEITLKEVLDSIHAIYGVGYGFENVYGEYKFRIELMEYFYGDGQVLDLGSPLSIKEKDSYKETTFSDLVFSTVEVGFSKYSSDENYTGDIDDFLTRAEYALPLTTVKGNYSQVSPMIASGRLIQATYESKADLTKAWKYDNSNFIVSVIEDSGNYTPELIASFQTIAGFSNSDATTVYNLRFAPVYMFLNHALIVNSALMGKALDKTIVNTSAEINRAFSALFASSEDCLLGDAQRLTRTSVGNIDIGNNFVGYRLFKPVQHELMVAMTTAQLNTIIDAMENNAADASTNHGYISYRDSEGSIQKGYVLIIKWNPNDEIAEVTTVEKADNYEQL